MNYLELDNNTDTYRVYINKTKKSGVLYICHSKKMTNQIMYISCIILPKFINKLETVYL